MTPYEQLKSRKEDADAGYALKKLTAEEYLDALAKLGFLRREAEAELEWLDTILKEN